MSPVDVEPQDFLAASADRCIRAQKSPEVADAAAVCNGMAQHMDEVA